MSTLQAGVSCKTIPLTCINNLSSGFEVGGAEVVTGSAGKLFVMTDTYEPSRNRSRYTRIVLSAYVESEGRSQTRPLLCLYG